ncbi:glycosyl transferase [Pseudooceanicola sediminis]|uniref:Glycosyl transferase n=1 Tax=Pseudooceanicola sediminis TaxID=2211117 RepID=A0A399J3F4_9RHOB|nr:glycosyl transferase [Puniceibacterium sp. HSS470]RII39948.1 glycosyl transferase [Pseudooceanicola sediminis]
MTGSGAEHGRGGPWSGAPRRLLSPPARQPPRPAPLS